MIHDRAGPGAFFGDVFPSSFSEGALRVSGGDWLVHFLGVAGRIRDRLMAGKMAGLWLC